MTVNLGWWIANIISKPNHNPNNNGIHRSDIRGKFSRCHSSWYRYFVDLENQITGQSTFVREYYKNHVRTIVNLIDKKTNRTQLGINYPNTIKNVKIINKQIIQHLFTYQTQITFKFYDTYKEIIRNSPKSGEAEWKLITGFESNFINLIEKANLETDEIFGACDECLKKLRFWDRRRNNKILREKEELDPNAWEDSKW